MEWNTVERATEKEIDTRTEPKGVGRLGWFRSDINRNIPTTWRWARGDYDGGTYFWTLEFLEPGKERIMSDRLLEWKTSSSFNSPVSWNNRLHLSLIRIGSVSKGITGDTSERRGIARIEFFVRVDTILICTELDEDYSCSLLKRWVDLDIFRLSSCVWSFIRNPVLAAWRKIVSE